MHAHKKLALALILSLPLLMAADCGHGGGSPCPQRAGALSAGDAPDAGVGAAEEDPAFSDDEAQAVGTGGSTGGGGPEECRHE
ncbi:MAG TPA: hypothetical protein VL500_01335 [Candidatus Eisenbacteria bacterium]|jgi:hypothetical protein|nr:hypothetical protein [Candidatus Eisenbacteria bacterium]